MRGVTAAYCTKCGKEVCYPKDADTWIKRSEFMDSLIAEGWTEDLFKQVCPDCREGEQ